ncbi:PIN domain-containing protein [Saccharothrix longispora]|uniref:PIN domain-containing protein n=1 Tax=Saccharothrix longispora TaxID=33920 RepID=UPI0028FD69FB|nr:PIN domain-containing protein [Saccharothrix longispora]MDU0290040.1 hypothetical protein [Saccharothrix longispora]
MQNDEFGLLNYDIPRMIRSPHHAAAVEGFIAHRAQIGARRHPLRPRANGPDSLVLDFNGAFALVEHGHYGISTMINAKECGFFGAVVSGLDKARRRVVGDRFAFLVDNNVRCIPLWRDSARLGVSAFIRFTVTNAPKAKLRNSINDMLILATAACHGLPLVTEDKLLARFAEDFLTASVEYRDTYAQVDFGVEEVKRALSRESKGYVNRGWQFLVR